jgi:GTP-binding protein YchF
MALQCGIVGLPNVGKSTLFNALSRNKAEAANFPFCTIEPNVAIVPVPDPRLRILEELVKPQRVVPATIEFVDIAGLVKGASRGEGLGNQFLANIREVNVIAHVVRCFDDDNIVHVDGRVDPVADKEIIDTELQLKDLETIEKRLNRTEKAARSGESRARREMDILMHWRSCLMEGKNLRTLRLGPDEQELMKELQLLTAKPVLYVANVDEDSLPDGNEHVRKLGAYISPEGAELIVICAAVEAQIAELDSETERMEFLQSYGLAESGLHRLIRAAYKLLDQITYFTAGEKEVRAWTIKRGWKAPQAAGVIHSDFERGFIRAEVIKLSDYQKYKTEQACKEAGKMAIEGREYEVRDGDVMHFRFNV